MNASVLSYRLSVIKRDSEALAVQKSAYERQIFEANRELFLMKFGLRWKYFQIAGCILGGIVMAPFVYVFVALGLAM
jgi:hypothetical protein